MAAPTTAQIESIRASQFRSSTRPPVKHEKWDEARNLWRFETQARLVVWCQKAPNWLVLPPALFFHFFLKRKLTLYRTHLVSTSFFTVHSYIDIYILM